MRGGAARAGPAAAANTADADRLRRGRLAAGLAGLAAVLLLAGLAVGSEGWSWQALQADLAGPDAGLIIGTVRAPRTAGALLAGSLLGLAGAVAQGLFRNPLADPFLLGSAAGASFAVVLALAAGGLVGQAAIGTLAAQWISQAGLAAAAFAGALSGVLLTLVLARGAQQGVRLLLAGVVVGIVLGAAGDLLTMLAPETLRGRQVFMLGSTGFIGWPGVLLLLGGLAAALPPALRLARALDAMTLGEDTAASLGLALPRIRLVLVVVIALATGCAVSQTGLVAFVGLVAPHLVRRLAPAPHGYTLAASAAAGGVLLLGADVLARGLIAPQELPVGVLTAVLGGSYLLWLLHRGRVA